MDAHLFRLFCESAISKLDHARIGKIQEAAPNHLVIPFHSTGSRENLFIRFGRKDPFCFIGSQRLKSMPRPSAQTMRLRKYFADKRIAAVVIQPWSRRLWLMASGNDENPKKSVWLCLDLTEGPSLHFLEENELPETEISHFPDAEQLETADWKKWPMLTPGLRKALVGQDQQDQLALLSDLEAGGGDVFLYTDESGHVEYISAWPLPYRHLRESIHEDVLDAFARAGQDLFVAPLYKAQEAELLDSGRKRIKRLEKTLAKLDQDEQRLKRMMARQADAELIRDHLWELEADARREGIEIEGKGIVLQPRLSILENMERWFHDARRGKRGLDIVAERRASIFQEIKDMQAIAHMTVARDAGNKSEAVRPSRMPAHIAGFLSSDGLTLMRGKDAKGNMAVRKRASGHDIWVHVENGPGAHVIIRIPYPGFAIPESTLLQAGQLAINKSWLNASASGSVIYAEARHVKSDRRKGPGQVLIDKLWQSRIIESNPAIEDQLEPI